MGSREPIKRVYIPYYNWEEWINGMYRTVDPETEKQMLQMAVEFTGDHIIYGNAMSEVIEAWPKTMLNSLTNTGINRKAFLGHCAVTLKLQIPEYITRMAWSKLTNEQRDLANNEAQKRIIDYEGKSRELHKNLGK